MLTHTCTTSSLWSHNHKLYTELKTRHVYWHVSKHYMSHVCMNTSGWLAQQEHHRWPYQNG